MTRSIRNPHDFEPIERRLASAFSRVKPREEFIVDLRQRLFYPAPEVMAMHPSQKVLWMLLGIFGSFLLMVGILLGILLQKQHTKT